MKTTVTVFIVSHSRGAVQFCKYLTLLGDVTLDVPRGQSEMKPIFNEDVLNAYWRGFPTEYEHYVLSKSAAKVHLRKILKAMSKAQSDSVSDQPPTQSAS